MAQMANERQAQQDFLQGMIMVVLGLILIVLLAVIAINVFSTSETATTSDTFAPQSISLGDEISASAPYGPVASVSQVQPGTSNAAVTFRQNATASGIAGILQPAQNTSALQAASR